MEALLTLDASCKFLSERREILTQNSVSEIPARVMQFWDKNPPDQIQTLLERNQFLCQRAGIEYIIFNENTAREYLLSNCDSETSSAYDIAVHPAMKCDVFRLAFLYCTGGHYIDADIVFRPNLPDLIAMKGDLLVYQWDSNNLSNLCNWLIGSRSRNAAMGEAMLRTARNVISACERDPQAALRNILGVSGPGIFTRAIATSLAARPEVATNSNIQTVSTAHRFIQLGPAYLKSSLSYKTDARHWLAAGEKLPPVISEAVVEAGEPPARSIEPQGAGDPPSTGWFSRVIQQISRGRRH